MRGKISRTNAPETPELDRAGRTFDLIPRIAGIDSRGTGVDPPFAEIGSLRILPVKTGGILESFLRVNDRVNQRRDGRDCEERDSDKKNYS